MDCVDGQDLRRPVPILSQQISSGRMSKLTSMAITIKTKFGKYKQHSTGRNGEGLEKSTEAKARNFKNTEESVYEDIDDLRS